MSSTKLAAELTKVAQAIAGRGRRAVEEKFQVIVDGFTWNNTEDKYDEGEVGRDVTIMQENNVGTFNSVTDAIKHVSQMTGVPEQDFHVFEGEDGRIDGDGMFDNESNYVGDDQQYLARWKAGEVRAWSGRISVYVRFAKTWEPTDQEIIKVSGLTAI